MTYDPWLRFRMASRDATVPQGTRIQDKPMPIPHTAMLCAMTAAACLFGAQTAAAQDIYYGSRAGMSLTATAQSGIGTANAVMDVEHQPRNAKEFCVEYLSDNSMGCVRRTMVEVQIKDRVTANCPARTWRHFEQEFVIERRATAADADITMGDYVVRSVESNEILDGSSASGYWTVLNTYQVLCPGFAE